MLEIMGGIWLACFIISTTLVALNYFRLKSRLHSKRITALNENLKKINLFWKSSEDNFSELTEGAVERDERTLLRSALFLELFALASFIGLFIVGIIIFSMAFLLKNRKEAEAFQSELSRNPDLTPDQIQKLVQEISAG